MQQVSWSLRIGLAFTFIYAAMGSLTSPKDWIWYIPGWVVKLFPHPELLLLTHGVFELLLALWLLSGKKIIYAAFITALDLLIITLLNIEVLSVVFRDVGLFFAAIALVFTHMNHDSLPLKKKKKK